MLLDIYVGFQNTFVMSVVITVFRICCDMTPESRNNSLLDNGSLGTFPQQRIKSCKPERCYEINTCFSGEDKHRITQELLEVVTYIRSSPKL
jgi:hypothetical protein